MDHKAITMILIFAAGLIYFCLGLNVFCQVSLMKEKLQKQGVDVGFGHLLTYWPLSRQQKEHRTFNKTVWMILRREGMPELLPQARRVVYSYAAGIGWLLLIILLCQIFQR